LSHPGELESVPVQGLLQLGERVDEGHGGLLGRLVFSFPPFLLRRMATSRRLRRDCSSTLKALLQTVETIGVSVVVAITRELHGDERSTSSRRAGDELATRMAILPRR
jgi:hypothetical protein